jgi:hypothetical protein
MSTEGKSAWGALRLAAGIALTILGALLMVGSIPAALAATGIQASVGRSGVVAQPLGVLRAAPGDVAVIVDGVSARLVTPAPPEWMRGALALMGTDADSLAARVGDVALVATPAAESVFLAVAPVEEVNDYLDGTPYSVAVMQQGEWPVVSVPGTGAPAAPEAQSWWLSASSGGAPELPAEVLDGQTLVLMRPDASPAPEASLRLEYRVPGASAALQSSAWIAVGASVGGLMIVLLGGALIVGRRDTSGAPA